MCKIYIIKAGTTFPDVVKKYGDFDLWTLNAMGLSHKDAVVKDVQNNQSLPALKECKGVVITGSHSMVTDHLSWSDHLLEWIPQLIKEEIPFLGICYGHQLLAEAMGGKVGYHPKGKEIGTVTVELSPESSKDPLFKTVYRPFSAHVTHAQCVLRLPPGAANLAYNTFEPHHAFRLGNCAWGVQFHPEYNIDIMKEYIIQQAVELKKSGHDISEIMMTVKDTPEASNLMKRFLDIVTQK